MRKEQSNASWSALKHISAENIVAAHPSTRAVAKGILGTSMPPGPPRIPLNRLLKGLALATMGLTALWSSPANAKTFYFYNVIYDYTINNGSVRDTIWCPSIGGCTPGQQMTVAGSFDFSGDAVNGAAQFSNVSVTFSLADYTGGNQKQNGGQQQFTYTGGGTNQYDSTNAWTTISFYDPNNVNNAGRSDSGVNLTISGSLSGLATGGTTSADFGVNIGNGTSNDNFCNAINTSTFQCTSQKNNLTLLSGSLVDTLPVPSPSIALGLIPFVALSAKRFRKYQLHQRKSN